MPKYKAIVEYDGTEFCGFQRQTTERTVQGELEAALHDLAGTPILLAGAGRTDSGVHAAGQVIAFSLPWSHSPNDLLQAVNARLAWDVSLVRVEPVPAEFHPRYDAVRRHYRYRILNRVVRSPLQRRFALHVREPLDVGAMNRAAQALLGEHDFIAFGRPPQGTNSVRHVFRATCRRQDEIVTFDVEANAFLYRMVRRMVGTLLQVGRGEISAQQLAPLLGGTPRGTAGPTVSPCGLCLMAVYYD
ncbi:MAG: tRNA pseudouridine(38-40) synthase TruA [Chloroflexi bacterium]|nr:tRNA pseudouridine(38-40) synthase TruA [Chloroflexota bacterium]